MSCRSSRHAPVSFRKQLRKIKFLSAPAGIPDTQRDAVRLPGNSILRRQAVTDQINKIQDLVIVRIREDNGEFIPDDSGKESALIRHVFPVPVRRGVVHRTKGRKSAVCVSHPAAASGK